MQTQRLFFSLSKTFNRQSYFSPARCVFALSGNPSGSPVEGNEKLDPITIDELTSKISKITEKDPKKTVPLINILYSFREAKEGSMEDVLNYYLDPEKDSGLRGREQTEEEMKPYRELKKMFEKGNKTMQKMELLGFALASQKLISKAERSANEGLFIVAKEEIAKALEMRVKWIVAEKKLGITLKPAGKISAEMRELKIHSLNIEQTLDKLKEANLTRIKTEAYTNEVIKFSTFKKNSFGEREINFKRLLELENDPIRDKLNEDQKKEVEGKYAKFEKIKQEEYPKAIKEGFFEIKSQLEHNPNEFKKLETEKSQKIWNLLIKVDNAETKTEREELNAEISKIKRELNTIKSRPGSNYSPMDFWLFERNIRELVLLKKNADKSGIGLSLDPEAEKELDGLLDDLENTKGTFYFKNRNKLIPEAQKSIENYKKYGQQKEEYAERYSNEILERINRILFAQKTADKNGWTTDEFKSEETKKMYSLALELLVEKIDEGNENQKATRLKKILELQKEVGLKDDKKLEKIKTSCSQMIDDLYKSAVLSSEDGVMFSVEENLKKISNLKSLANTANIKLPEAILEKINEQYINKLKSKGYLKHIERLIKKAKANTENPEKMERILLRIERKMKEVGIESPQEADIKKQIENIRKGVREEEAANEILEKINKIP